MATEIHRNIAPPHHEGHLGGRLPSPKDGADAGEQFLGAEGLGQVVVSSHVEGADLVSLVAPCADHDYRGDAAAFERGEHMPAIHKGQPDVEQHDVERLRLERLNAGRAIGGELDLVPTRLQRGDEPPGYAPVTL